jgi:hypothetical protein
MGLPDLEALQRRTRAWLGAETGWRLYYTFFSRTGFTQSVRTRAGDDAELLLFGPEEVLG